MFISILKTSEATALIASRVFKLFDIALYSVTTTLFFLTRTSTILPLEPDAIFIIGVNVAVWATDTSPLDKEPLEGIHKVLVEDEVSISTE